MKEKKEFKKWEKIFIIISCLVIAVSFFVYLYRFIYYYRIEHVKYKVNTLIQEVTNNTVTTGDGLYILDEDNYFYKGVNVSNYVWYSGNLYRIVSINGTNIKMISDNNLSVIAWGSNSKFNESYLYSWLNNYEDNKSVYLESVSNYQVYLKEFNYCNSSINKKCINKDEYYASLLTRSEYLNAGGKLSYLNNESNFWIIDDTNEYEKSYVFKEGGIGSEDENTTVFASFGVRPVITINGNITNIEGTGTLDDPYVVKEETGDIISEKKMGEYVSYKNYIFRISNKYENGIKLILDKKIENATSEYSRTLDYLNNNFLGNFSNLGKCTYNIGSYGSSTDYDYKNVYTNTLDNNIGIPSIGELYLGDDEAYWLFNGYDQNDLAYKLNTNSTIIADTKYSLNGIRPVICLNKDIKVKSGNGTKASPYILED